MNYGIVHMHPCTIYYYHQCYECCFLLNYIYCTFSCVLMATPWYIMFSKIYMIKRTEHIQNELDCVLYKNIIMYYYNRYNLYMAKKSQPSVCLFLIVQERESFRIKKNNYSKKISYCDIMQHI